MHWPFYSVCVVCVNLSNFMISDSIFTDDDQDEDSMEVLQELENIDDECDQHGIAFVKIGLYCSE